ncbi:uncharacterized protein [Spinacia oleracea]|uniref:Ubiquitin-like protease family profile domain-containing protein n=1 Tax=Spinacia oleracea TaxID=3562 RepID=A0A9R0K938_SPIOL|nr:uncharacterized protein LOC110801906 [Spinacia oleracea]
MQQPTQGTLIPQRNVDALCMALGKEDHRGFVCGVGGLNISYRKAFGKPDRRGTGLRLNQQSMEEIKEEVKASLMEEFEQKLKDVESQVREQLLSMMQQNGGLKFPEDSDLSQTPGSDLPPPMLKEATSENNKSNGKSKEKLNINALKSGESATNVKGPIQQVREDILASVGEKSKLLNLQHVMESQPELYGVTAVHLDAKVFHFEKDAETFVTAEDITLLLRGARLNISVVQLFMMFLIDQYKSSFDSSHIGFLCPERIEASNVRHHHKVTSNYMSNVFLSSRDRGDAGNQLILAPYFEEEHWMLIVINLTCGKAFKFDSSKSEKERSLTIKDCLDMAYNVYEVQGRKGRSSKLKWFSIKCAQQTGGAESGYYVMKFMHEIVTMYNDCQNMEKDYQRGDEPYNDEEINEVLEQWAVFFEDKYLEKSF